MQNRVENDRQLPLTMLGAIQALSDLYSVFALRPDIVHLTGFVEANKINQARCFLLKAEQKYGKPASKAVSCNEEIFKMRISPHLFGWSLWWNTSIAFGPFSLEKEYTS